MQITSEVKNGFKETEIGLIPEDWEIKPLGQKAEIRGGRRVLGIQRVAMIPMELIQNDRVYAGYNFLDAKEIKSGVFCEEGDILLPKITPCIENGKQGIVPRVPNGVAIATTEVYPLRCKEGLDPLFLFYLLKTQKFRNVLINSMVGTTGRRRVPKDVVLKLLIPIPPLPEQQKIAFTLSKIQQAIQQQDKIIEVAKNLKKTIMHKLFTEGIGHTEFKDTEIGKIPKSWDVVKLEDIAERQTLVDPKRNPNKKFKYIDVSSISREFLSIIDYKEYFGKDAPSRARKMVKKGDIIFATVRPALKRISVVPDDFDGEICSTAFCVIRCKKEAIVPNFVFEYVSTDKFVNRVSELQKGTNYPAVTDSDILAQKIPLPPIQEQQKIASLSRTLNRKIEKEAIRKTILQRLFKTMLHKLMTGEIRVKDLELGVSHVD